MSVIASWIPDQEDWCAVSAEQEKRAAAEAAALLVEDGMTVGLGTGTTVRYLLPALARRGLSVRCVATSARRAGAAAELGLVVEPFNALDALDIAIDGADQIAPDGWLIKGGGGAHTREKIVACAAARFVVIADSTKPTPGLHPPVPVELLQFGQPATLRLLGDATVRAAALSPDGGVLADYQAPFDDPAKLAARLSEIPGVIGHGLFSPKTVSTILIGRGNEVERRILRG